MNFDDILDPIGSVFDSDQSSSDNHSDFSMPDPTPNVMDTLDTGPDRYDTTVDNDFSMPDRNEMLPPGPSPVRDLSGNMVGTRDPMQPNQIRPVGGGLPTLDVGPGGFVRDVRGKAVGHIGPGNTLRPLS